MFKTLLPNQYPPPIPGDHGRPIAFTQCSSGAIPATTGDYQCFLKRQKKNVMVSWLLKGVSQILGQTFYKNTKKSSLYSQTLLIFIHRTPVVKRHLITREITDLLWPMLTPTGNMVYFYMSSSFISTLKIHRQSFKNCV